MNMDLIELNKKIVEFHHDKDLIDGSTALIQTSKLLEEFTELVAAQHPNTEPSYIVYLINKMLRVLLENGRIKTVPEENAKAEYKDSIGDQFVVLVNLAAQHGLTMEECVQAAYDVISKRTGKLVDGVFVKSEDL